MNDFPSQRHSLAAAPQPQYRPFVAICGHLWIRSQFAARLRVLACVWGNQNYTKKGGGSDSALFFQALTRNRVTRRFPKRSAASVLRRIQHASLNLNSHEH